MKKKRENTPRGHRLRAGAVPVRRRRKKTKRFWFSVTVVILAGGVLAICVQFGMHDGTVHHLALAVLAERIALGLGGEGGDEG